MGCDKAAGVYAMFEDVYNTIVECVRVSTTIIIIIIIIITDLYSAFRSEDTEALDAAQEDKVSLNRLVFKWRLKVRMFSHSQISAGREFQVDGAATEKARRASSVCMRGTTSIGASEERRTRGGAWVCTSSLRYVGVAVVRTLWWSV